MIDIQKLHKSYPIGSTVLHVLKGLDLCIEEGEFVAIMGASGSGKSTLLNILGLLDTQDEGTYLLNKLPIENLDEKKAAQLRNKFLGFVFQSFNLIAYKTALENVALPLYYQGVPKKERLLMAMDYLEKVGLKDWASHLPNELSGGQKQRVAVARALVTSPKVVLADDYRRSDGIAKINSPRGDDFDCCYPRGRYRRTNRSHHPSQRRGDCQ